MATVRQTLALNDRMSPVLSKIITAMHSTLNVMEQVNTASERGISASAFANTRNQINSANIALEEALNNTNKVDDAAKQAKKGFGGWQAAIVTANQGIELIQRGIHGVNRLTGFFDGLMGISARLNLVTEDQLGLQDKIFQAAQRSRGEYTEMASSVAKLNLLAADTFAKFGGEDAAVSFAETLNKAFVLSGASTQERNSAMYQMTQALSSGRLQGDEYRSIIENAPLVAKSIEDYMRNVKGAEGTMKDWASEGLLTSEVIIAATQNAAKQIDEQFADMPMKFGDHMTRLKNEAIRAMAPLTQRFTALMQSEKFTAFIDKVIIWIQAGIGWLDKLIDKIEQIGSTPGFRQMASEAGTALGMVITLLGWAIDAALWFVEVVTSNWTWIGPIVWGVVAALIAYKTITSIITMIELAKNAVFLVGLAISASKAGLTLAEAAATMTNAEATKYATARQWALNSATYAFPGMWIILIILAIIVAIVAVINIINKVTGSTTSAIGVIIGALSVAAAFIWNLFLGIFDLVLGVFNALVNPIIAWVNFFANVFTDPIGSVIHLFGSMADKVLGIIESIAKAMDKVFGSNMAGTVAGWRKSLDSKIESAAKKYGNGAYEEVMGELNLSSESLGLGRWAYSDAYDWGYNAGESLSASIDSLTSDLFGGYDFTQSPADPSNSVFNPEDYTGNGGAFNVDATGSEVSLSDDDIKYLRDVAKLEYVNQYTTLRPVVQAQFGDIHETADVNQVLQVFEDAISAAYESSLERG